MNCFRCERQDRHRARIVSYARVADNTDEGFGGDSRKPVVNDNGLYHSLSPSCPGQDRTAGMDVAQTRCTNARSARVLPTSRSNSCWSQEFIRSGFSAPIMFASARQIAEMFSKAPDRSRRSHNSNADMGPRKRDRSPTSTTAERRRSSAHRQSTVRDARAGLRRDTGSRLPLSYPGQTA